MDTDVTNVVCTNFTRQDQSKSATVCFAHSCFVSGGLLVACIQYIDDRGSSDYDSMITVMAIKT